MVELLLIRGWSLAKEFAFKLCLLTGLVLEGVQDALLILFASSAGKQLQAIKQDSNSSLFYGVLNCCFFL